MPLNILLILKLTEENSNFLLNFVGLRRRDLLDLGYVIYSVFLIKYLILQRWKINSNLTIGKWNNTAEIIKPFKSFKSKWKLLKTIDFNLN